MYVCMYICHTLIGVGSQHVCTGIVYTGSCPHLCIANAGEELSLCESATEGQLVDTDKAKHLAPHAIAHQGHIASVA